MIRFGRREKVLPSLLMLLSLVVLAGTLAFMIVVPKPGAALPAGGSAARRRIVDDIADARRGARQTRAATKPHLWQGDPEAVTATILARLTTQTGHRSLKLLAFRPDRPQAFEGITELRFDAEVSGPYAGIHALLNTLDAPGSKVALRSVQLTSTQAAGGAVSATLGLSAFVATDPSLTNPSLMGPTGGGHGSNKS